MYKKITSILILLVVILFPIISFADDDIEEEFNEAELVEEIRQAAANVGTGLVPAQSPAINSRAAIVIDRKTGIVIYEKNASQVRKMASTTKILTAIVVIEKANFEDVVTVSKKAGGTGGSTMGLKAGDKVSVKDLLYGLMLPSGNDAAVALAEHVGGSVEGFARLMNEKVAELGLKNSHFISPHGLDSEGHFTTAYELAILANYALNIPIFAEIVKAERYIVNVNGVSKELGNTNELLGYMEGVYGVKTGFTNGANRCLVTAIKRGNLDIICVVLGADTKKNRTKDSISLIEYTYKNYKLEKIEDIIKNSFNEWKAINEKRIIISKGVESTPELILENIPYKEYPLKNGDIDRIEFEFNYSLYKEAPIQKSEIFGTMDVKLDNNILFSINIVNKEEIETKKIKNYLINIFTNIPSYMLQGMAF